MKSSSATTLGVILAVLAVLMAIGFLRLIIGVPMGIFDGFSHNWGHRSGSWFWPFAGFAGFFGLFYFVLWILIAFWVHRDAESRGMEGILWALIVFFVHIVGLIIYLVVRTNHPVSAGKPAGPNPPTPPTSSGETASTAVAASASPATPACKFCGRPVEKDQAYCAACGQSIGPVCTKCGKEIEREWVVCPFCGEKI